MYLLASSLAAALLDGHFEHPAVLTSSEPFDKVSAVIHAYTEFFRRLLGASRSEVCTCLEIQNVPVLSSSLGEIEHKIVDGFSFLNAKWIPAGSRQHNLLFLTQIPMCTTEGPEGVQHVTTVKRI